MAGEAMIQACADMVLRADPHLHATALFAPPPVRARLMVLYAFDCELSRAVRVSAESLIPRMRLQWWRDVIVEAAEGGAPKAHDVAGPLCGLIRSDPALVSDITDLDGKDVLSRMIDGYERELELPFADQTAFEEWADARFGARLGLAGSISPLGAEFGHDADFSAAPRVLALGLALRTAARMSRERGVTYLPGLASADIGALARGDLSEAAGVQLGTLSRGLLDELKLLRRSRRIRGEALIAHLPVAREARVLGQVVRNPATIVGQVDEIDRPFQGLALAWRAWRRRW